MASLWEVKRAEMVGWGALMLLAYGALLAQEGEAEAFYSAALIIMILVMLAGLVGVFLSLRLETRRRRRQRPSAGSGSSGSPST
jgi:hypothetical protein